MKTVRYIWISFVLLTISQSLFGTKQIPDYLIYKGDTLAIHSSPLEDYFENHIRPESVFEESGLHSTACYRGYIAYWELRNDSLFLKSVQGDTVDIKLSAIFIDRKVKREVFADWYSNTVFNPFGEQLFGYVSFYEFEREFVFKQGMLVETRTFDNSKSSKSKYTKEPGLLQKYLKENIDYSTIDKPDKRAKVFVQIIKVDASGKIDSVGILRGSDPQRDAEALRLVKSIPKWDVLYRRGEIFNLRWTIPVIFGSDDKGRMTH